MAKKATKKTPTGPRLLVLDIENSFLVGGMWGLWNQNIGLNQLFDNGKVMCWAAKWVGEKEIQYKNCNEKTFLGTVWKLLDEADAVITFNGRRHDLPMLNREFIKNGMGPYSPVKHIDLYETVKKQFKFPSNKMAHVTEELGIGKKIEHEGFPLWVKCLKDDEAAWKKMEKYNKGDVKLTEKFYLKIRPWCNTLPNYALYSSTSSILCPTCGSDHLHSRGYYRSQVATFNKLQCQACQSWCRTRFTEVPKEDRKNIVVKA